jgi:uncharacterized protein (TIGR03905 family)
MKGVFFMYSYKMKGTCSRKLKFEIIDDVIVSCAFESGCTGNLEGISQLVIGQPIDRVIGLLQGIHCRNGTSCPDQLARALIKYKNERAAENNTVEAGGAHAAE